MKACAQCGVKIEKPRHDQKCCSWACRRALGGGTLTLSEARLYAALVNADGAVVPYADLVTELGYEPMRGRSDSVLVRTHIFNIRRKLGEREIGSGNGLFGYYWTAGTIVPLEPRRAR